MAVAAVGTGAPPIAAALLPRLPACAAAAPLNHCGLQLGVLYLDASDDDGALAAADGEFLRGCAGPFGASAK